MILASTTAFYLACAAILAGAADHDPHGGAVEVVHYQFECDEDQDFDGLPDGWVRRKGPDFPNYVRSEIDTARGHGTSKQSLRFLVNGGAAAMYSQPVPVDPQHTFVFRGQVRTQGLQNDAAVVSVSLLNNKRQRIQRFMSAPVTGTHEGWAEVTVGPIVPRSDIRFVSIGCHLIPGKKRADIRGAVWFDELWLGKVPQLSLATNFEAHLREPNSKVQVTAQATGLDSQWSYTLQLETFDASNKSVASAVFPLKAPPKTESEEQQKAPEPVVWELPPQPNGYYEVRALLKRDGVAILDRKTSFAVMDRFEDGGSGEFGWSISRLENFDRLEALADAARQAGVNWVKFPLWQSLDSDDHETSRKISDLFDTFNRHGITTVGLLNNPPAEVRRQFSRDWTGISEVFTLPPSFWFPTVEKVVAHFSSQIRYWQLGDEEDPSFIGMATLPQTLATVKREFDRIGRDTQIGIPWNWQTPIPARSQMPGAFLSIGSPASVNAKEIAQRLKATAASDQPRWVLLKPLSPSGHTPEERSADLVRRMISAKVGGAEAVFAADIFDEENGLLGHDCAPTLLFLPWRTAALALRGAQHMGSLVLPNESENHVFARHDEAVVVIWNKVEVEEELYLGENAVITDVLGRTLPDPPRGTAGRQKIRIGPNPIIIRHCSEPIIRWWIAVRFEKGGLPSKTGKQREAILGLNTFSQGVSGQATVNVPNDWHVEPAHSQFKLSAGEKFSLPLSVELPSNTSLGTRLISIDFEISGQPYVFRVYQPYQVGVGDVMLHVTDSRMPNGELQITQLIVNNTLPLESLNFECNLFVPNHKRQLKKVTKLGNGKDTQLYLVPDADSLRGQELLLRARQIGGQRVLNYRWKVGENWDKPTSTTFYSP